MLDKILSPLTTASSLGVTLRYVSTIIGSIIAVLGILGWLTPDQVEALTRKMPELMSAIGALVALIVPIYAVFTKSASDRAAEAAKAIDKRLPADFPVVIKTPGADPDIVVSGK